MKNELLSEKFFFLKTKKKTSRERYVRGKSEHASPVNGLYACLDRAVRGFATQLCSPRCLRANRKLPKSKSTLGPRGRTRGLTIIGHPRSGVGAFEKNSSSKRKKKTSRPRRRRRAGARVTAKIFRESSCAFHRAFVVAMTARDRNRGRDGNKPAGSMTRTFRFRKRRRAELARGEKKNKTQLFRAHQGAVPLSNRHETA